MLKIICKKEYDTEKSEFIQKNTVGSYGDPDGYEECLFKTPTGLYFLYVNGGAKSPYPQPDILRLAKTKVSQWLENT